MPRGRKNISIVAELPAGQIPESIGIENTDLSFNDGNEGIADYINLVNAAENAKQARYITVQGACWLAGAVRGFYIVPDENRTRLQIVANFGENTVDRSGDSIAFSNSMAMSLNKISSRVIDRSGNDNGRINKLLRLTGSLAPAILVLQLSQSNGTISYLLLEFNKPKNDVQINPGIPWFLKQAVMTIKRLSELESTREQLNDLKALVELTKLATQSNDFQETLRVTLQYVHDLIGVERVVVMLYDATIDSLVAQIPGIGSSDEDVRKYVLPISGGGTSVRTFLTRKPYVCNNHDPNALQYWIQYFRTKRYITVPLIVGDQCIGILHTANKKGGDFTQNDLSLVMLLASHLGLSMQNARLLEQERKAFMILNNLTLLSENQRQRLQHTIYVHDKMMEVVLKELNVNDTLDLLYKILGNPVIVIDRFLNLIAYHVPENTDIVDKEHMINITDKESGNDQGFIHRGNTFREILRHIENERRPSRILPSHHPGINQPLVIAPVMIINEIVAYICILENCHSLDEIDFITLERAAIAIALQLSKEHALTQAEYRRKGDFIAELISGKHESAEPFAHRASHLGIDLNNTRALLLVRVDKAENEIQDPISDNGLGTPTDSLLEIVERVCRFSAPNSVIATIKEEIIILANCTSYPEDKVFRYLHDFADRLRTEITKSFPAMTVSVGIGNLCKSIDDYPFSYQHAQGSLDVVRACGQKNCTIAFNELGIYGLIFDIEDRKRLFNVVKSTLGNLLEYDRQHSAVLTKTLEQYLFNDCNLARTARSLHIHLSTLRYRLQRIEEINETDLSSVEEKFNLLLAFKILRTIS